MKYQIPKGLFDILPYGADKDWRFAHLWQFLEKIANQVSADYNYQEIRTPIFEHTEVFHHSVGEETDIVAKEMYTFVDKGKRSISLRPEGTASIVRSFVEKNLYNLQTYHKFYYLGPMFRYERMQKGRYRQFHQFGVEVMGPMSYEIDVEVIDLLYEFLRRLGLKNLTMQISSVGSSRCRKNFKEKLLQYLTPHFSELSKDSQERFEKNPLRILDSKDPQDKKILENAPSILEMLSDDAAKHFEKVCSLLKKIGIPFEINDKLVRGLDYYTNTVFECISSQLGAQNAVGGGGRYDMLIQSFGGPDLPGVGFATGIERIIQVMLEQKIDVAKQIKPFVYFIALDNQAKEICFEIMTSLRHIAIPADIDFSGKKLQKALAQAVKEEASYCVIIGEEERKKEMMQVKNLQTREQQNIAFKKACPFFTPLWKQFINTQTTG